MSAARPWDFGYAPVTLHQGLERTIPWMREHNLL